MTVDTYALDGRLHLPDRDTSLADAHVTKEHNLVVVHVLACVVIEGGPQGSVAELIVTVCCHRMIIMTNL